MGFSGSTTNHVYTSTCTCMYLEDHLVHICCVVMGFLPAVEEEHSLTPAVAGSLMTESQSLVAVETFLGVTKKSGRSFITPFNAHTLRTICRKPMYKAERPIPYFHPHTSKHTLVINST